MEEIEIAIMVIIAVLAVICMFAVLGIAVAFFRLLG
jgi:hypothetical protein